MNWNVFMMSGIAFFAASAAYHSVMDVTSGDVQHAVAKATVALLLLIVLSRELRQ